MLNTYAALFRTQINYRFQYRINMIFWLIGVTSHSVVYIAVWEAVARSSISSLHGFNAQDFAAYYWMVAVVQNITVAPLPSLLSRRLRTGDFSFRLLQPLHPIHHDIVENLAYKVVLIAIFVPVAATIALMYGVRLTTPFWAAWMLIPALIGAAVLRFMFHYVVMNVAFWITETNGISQLHGILQTLLGGILAPLPLLPEVMRMMSYALPFRWIWAFPIELALGRLTLSEAGIGFAAQAVWIVICIVVFRLLWSAGLRRYAAVGG